MFRFIYTLIELINATLFWVPPPPYKNVCQRKVLYLFVYLGDQNFSSFSKKSVTIIGFLAISKIKKAL